MAVFDLYSKRQKRLRGDVPDVYTYDDLPQEFRVQIVYLIRQGLRTESSDPDGNVRTAFERIVKILCKEYGLFYLPPSGRSGRSSGYEKELIDYFLSESDVEKCLDVVELTFKFVDRLTRNNNYVWENGPDEKTTAVLEELNTRFREHAVGFQYVEGEIVRLDSELIHAEAVKPALRLLNSKDYAGPHAEFLSAYEHYRHGKNKEALNDCLKAFESTMKAICDKRGWPYHPGDTAKKLIAVCFEKGLIPPFWQAQFNHLQGLLESSIPTGRNKLSGHGQGAAPQTVPDHITAYMLHMTASTLVFLTTAEKELP